MAGGLCLSGSVLVVVLDALAMVAEVGGSMPSWWFFGDGGGNRKWPK